MLNNAVGKKQAQTSWVELLSVQCATNIGFKHQFLSLSQLNLYCIWSGWPLKKFEMDWVKLCRLKYQNLRMAFSQPVFTMSCLVQGCGLQKKPLSKSARKYLAWSGCGRFLQHLSVAQTSVFEQTFGSKLVVLEGQGSRTDSETMNRKLDMSRRLWFVHSDSETMTPIPHPDSQTKPRCDVETATCETKTVINQYNWWLEDCARATSMGILIGQRPVLLQRQTGS